MAAKYPACGRAGLGNDRNPVGPPPPSTPPAFSSLPGPGTPPKSPIPPGCRRGDAPAPPPLTCTRASVRSSLMASSSLGETHTPPSARGTPKRCVSCVPPPRTLPIPRLCAPKSRCPTRRRKQGRAAGGLRDVELGARRGSPLPEFCPPPPPNSAGSRRNRGPGVRQPSRHTLRFAVPQFRQIGNR